MTGRRCAATGSSSPTRPSTRASTRRHCSRRGMTLDKVLRKTFKDERLREVAAFPAALEGHDLRNVPAWMGMWTYVEQRFGSWTVPGRDGVARGRARLAAGDPRRHGAAVHPGPRPRAVRWQGRRRPHRERHRRRRPRRLRDRPAPAARARAERGPDHARDPAGRSATSASSARCPTSRPRWCCTATRCWCCAPAASLPPARTRGRSWGAAARRGHRDCPARAGIRVRDQVEVRVDRSPLELVQRVGRVAVRRAVAGPQHRQPPAGSAYADRERLHGRCPRHSGRRDCRRSASRPRWSRR